MADMHDEIFAGTTFSSLLKDIYENSVKKRNQISILINELRPLIKDVGQATLVVPLIREYLEVGVKNDEQLVKLAAVYQKYIAAEERLKEVQSVSGALLTEEEKKQLLADIKKDVESATEDVLSSKSDVDESFEKINKKLDDIISEPTGSGAVS